MKRVGFFSFSLECFFQLSNVGVLELHCFQLPVATVTSALGMFS
uniref:Uncharacterized protein n=1 Tax=Anguilla anguilla TaxID=7936 RepID=A0A0E9RBE0_ANGAN